MKGQEEKIVEKIRGKERKCDGRGVQKSISWAKAPIDSGPLLWGSAEILPLDLH